MPMKVVVFWNLVGTLVSANTRRWIKGATGHVQGLKDLKDLRNVLIHRFPKDEHYLLDYPDLFDDVKILDGRSKSSSDFKPMTGELGIAVGDDPRQEIQAANHANCITIRVRTFSDTKLFRIRSRTKWETPRYEVTGIRSATEIIRLIAVRKLKLPKGRIVILK